MTFAIQLRIRQHWITVAHASGAARAVEEGDRLAAMWPQGKHGGEQGYVRVRLEGASDQWREWCRQATPLPD